VPNTNVRLQAYPGTYPGDHNTCGSGAVETNTLGYTADMNGAGDPMDAVYRLSYTLAHTGTTLNLDFTAQGLEALNNESWGITNVQVSVAAPSAPVVRSSVPVRHIARAAPRATTTQHRVRSVSRQVNKRQVSKKKPGTPAHPTRLHPKEKPPGT
jgi:hypothetical protein